VVSAQQVVARYCVGCHNDRTRSGGLSLSGVNVEDAATHAEVLEKMARKLRAGVMPPQGSPRPDAAVYAAVISSIEGTLDRYAAQNPNPGRPALHRMNRAEYRNAIRDLLALDVDVASLLPSDNSSYGFDNIAAVLGISPVLLDRYVRASDKIARLALGNPDVRPVVETYRTKGDLTQEDHLDGLPIGTRGGLVATHTFPATGEYVLRVKLARSATDQIRGLTEPQDLEITVDGERVAFFTVTRPPGGGGGFGGGPRGPEADADLFVRLRIEGGPRSIAAAFIKKTSATENVLLQPFERSNINANDQSGQAHVGTLSVEGPFEAVAPTTTPSRARLFVCAPRDGEDEGCASRILGTVARRAYRRPLVPGELDTLMAFFREGRATGSFDAGIEFGLRRVLASPAFIFRIESETPSPNGAYRVADIDLASRLSFFLWSSIPDEELLEAAIAGRLRQPEVLEQQVRRMLADTRSSALIENFIGQWLQLRRVDDRMPSLEGFPDFDDNLRQAFKTETELFVESVIRENRSALDLLNADYTFVNERLARHYGIPNVYGSHFRRVTLPDESRRGILGQGSILVVNAYPTRTSPVIRGKWILENILGTPPPPPPPDVPGLPDNAAGEKPKSVRERMENHRRNPVCATCHRVMDPLGFALENFDAVGAWRTTDSGVPVDARGQTPDGIAFEGLAGLRSVLLSKPETFVVTLTERLLTYALGRGVEYYDMPTVRSIVRGTAPERYRFQELVVGIVRSMPFQMKSRVSSEAAATTATATP